MIESLSISKVATYGEQPEKLSGLSRFNFIFGSNGKGVFTLGKKDSETHEFEEIFKKSKHTAHYKMMMGEDFELEAA